MRRTVAVLFAFFFTVFTGCAQQEIKAEEIKFDFQCKANVIYGEQKAECRLNRSAPGILSISIISGDMKGLIYDWSGEDFSSSYSGLTAKSEECVLPQTSFAMALKQTLDGAEKAGALTRTHGNEFSGSINDFNFTVTTDGTGQIKKISIPKYGITAELFEYSQQGL